MTRDEAAQIKRAGFWVNAAATAWNMGEASWLFDDRGSVLTRVWNEGYSTEGDDVAKAKAAADAVEAFCKTKGIDPKRHRSHRVGG